MKFFIITLIYIFINIVPTYAQTQTCFYVSLMGNDNNNGTISQPLATIDGAKSKIRNLNYPTDVTVYIRGGEYPIEKTINFGKNDFFENNTITYEAFENENVVFNGGKKVTEITKNIPPETKLLPNIKDKILCIDLSKYSDTINDFSDMKGIFELVYNDEILNYARYPNDGYLYVENVINKGILNTSGAKWTCSDKILESLNDVNLCVGGNLLYEWYWNLNKVKAIENNTIETVSPFVYGDEVGILKEMPFYFTNSAYLIDKEGEYFIDKTAKKLYFYPIGDYTSAKIEIVSLNKTMFELNDVKNLIFKNITFKNGMSHCFNTNNCTEIKIDRCTIKNFGDSAANFWGSKNCSFVNSKIYNMGNKGINVQGGNIELMESSGFQMVNSEVSNLGRINKNQAVAIWTHGYNGGTGCYVGYNKFYNMPFQALGMGFEGIIENNEIFNVCTNSGDMGAIYIGGTFISTRGIKIRNNYIYDIPSNFKYSKYGTNGIYLDIMANGIEVYNNIVRNVSRNHYYSSSGGYNKVYNNIFIGNEKSQMYSLFPNSNQTIRVMGYAQDETTENILPQVPSFAYTNKMWLYKYPEIKKSLDSTKPMIPYHEIKNNILYKCGEMYLPDSVKSTTYSNWQSDVNPGFKDYRYGNWELKSDARVYCTMKDFKRIDMSEIGLRKE